MQSSVVRRVLWVRGLRAFGDGFVSLLLPAYLIALGFGPLQVGAIATCTLLGSGVMTLAVGMNARRFRYRSLLLAAAVVMSAAGLGVSLVAEFLPVRLIAIIGT